MKNSALISALMKAGGVVCIALLIVLSVLPNASTLLFTWPLVFYGQLLLLVPIILLGLELIKQPTGWRREWTTLGLMALVIGISVVFSRRPAFSLEAALFLFSGLAWCGLVALRVSTTENSKAGSDLWLLPSRLIGLAFFLPLLAGLAYWLRDWNEYAAPTNNILSALQSLSAHRNQYPFGHWNYTGGFPLLALPWFGSQILIERKRWRAVWLAFAIVGIVIFFSAYSRGAVLGAMAIMAMGVCVVIYSKIITKRQVTLLAIAVIAIASGLLASNARLRTAIVSPASIFQPNEGDVQRIAMLQGGWLLAKKSPWIGHGPGMTPFIFPEVRAQLDGGVETAFQLHNGPLQLWVDHGILGLLCATAFAAILLRSALHWLKAPPSTLRTFALASALSLVGYFVMFVTDYQLNVVALVAALGLQAGLVLAAPTNNPPITKAGTRWFGFAMMATGTAILIVLIPAWRARQSYWTAWTTDQPAETLAMLERTVELAPRNPYYLNQLALRRARISEKTSDVATASALRTQARAELAHSIALDPAQEPIHASLGWLWLSEDPKRAEVHFRAAVVLLPDRDTVHLGLALCRLAQNDQPGTVRELALECLANPLFVASPFWTQEPFLSLRAGTMAQLFKDYAHALQLPATPEWRKPQLTYASAFVRWWLGGEPPSTDELKGALPYQQQFMEQLTAHNQTPSGLIFPSWRLLDQARLNPAQAETILRSAKPQPSDQALAGALARLSRPTTDFATLLRSAEPTHIGIVSNQITRGHYSIMNNILDGPGYEDLAPRITDAFTTEYAAPIFPLRSAIPGPVMQNLILRPRD
ncbi:MAG: O-antigen ligase family protein [Verrucomicrobia bacterium]|nr:O-antigen ligase family protein [Verrucomicrobiota bacterium]